jgi:hypothetical protein
MMGLVGRIGRPLELVRHDFQLEDGDLLVGW